MTTTEEFIENFLEHRSDYDPVKAREYYLRTRKLKGRAKGRAAAPGKKVRRVEEDGVPETSPSGAKLIDYDGRGAGRATYADGSTFDGAGWNSTGHKLNTRLQAAQEKIQAAKVKARKMPPERRKKYLARISELQKALNAAKNKAGNERRVGDARR